MTAATRGRVGLGVAGLAAAIAFAVDALRASDPPAAAEAAARPVACSSCDARHARLRDARIAPLEVQK